MKSRETTIAIVSAMLSLLPSQSEPRAPALNLPNEVAKYNAWPQLLKEPHPVSWELWIRCMAPTAADWESARKKTGPHTEHVIMVYGNPAAVAGLSSKGNALPLGAVIAKEKRHLEAKGSPDGVAFMLKRKAPEFKDTGGWEFLYYPASGAKRATHERCASCHRSAASRDYVFGEYPRQEGGRRRTMSLVDLIKEEQRRRELGLPDPPPRRPSFAERTGQAKKLRAAYWLSTIGFLMLFWGWFNTSTPNGVGVLIVATLVGAVGFLAQCLAVRCPQCPVAVVWHTYKTRRHSEAQAAALLQHVCPKCGYDPP